MVTELMSLHVIGRAVVYHGVILLVVGGWVEMMIIQLVFMLLVGVIVRWEVTHLSVWNAISLTHGSFFAMTNICISVLAAVPLFNNAAVSKGLFYAQSL